MKTTVFSSFFPRENFAFRWYNDSVVNDIFTQGKELDSVLQCGQKVVYGIHGVCVVLELEMRSVDRKMVEYYVLEPVEQPGTRFYVPTRNESAVAKLRPLLRKEDLDALISSSVSSEDVWIADENQRKQRYRELINGGDRAALIAMVKTLHIHKEQQIAAGRKFHLCDENFLRDAQKLLSAEFSLVLNIAPDEVGSYIQENAK